jgi:hypothetical protein
MTIDANGASNLVKNYFESIMGSLNVYRFIIDSVILDNERNVWVVRCSFFPSLGSSKKVFYEVEIKQEDGSFGLVKQISE